MDIEEGVKMGEHPNLGPVNITVGSRIVPFKRREDPVLEELRRIRAVLEHIDGNINRLTRPNWLVRLFRRIFSWVA